MASFWCLKNRNIEEDAKELLWGTGLDCCRVVPV